MKTIKLIAQLLTAISLIFLSLLLFILLLLGVPETWDLGGLLPTHPIRSFVCILLSAIFMYGGICTTDIFEQTKNNTNLN